MKRPLAVTGFVYLAASAAAVFLGQSALIPVGAALLFCAAFSLKCTRLRMGGIVPLVLITSLAAFVSVGVYTASSVTPVQGLSGQQVIIEAELCDLPYQRYDQYYYTVNARELKARDGTLYHDVKLLLYCDEPLDAAPYDIIKTEVRLSARQNSYDNAKGIIYRAYLPYPQVASVNVPESRPLNYYALKLRYHVLERIDSLLPEEQADFVKAFLLGDRYSLSDETVSVLRSAGLSHIIAVSGLHVTIITYLLMILLSGVLRLKKRTSALICVLALLLYMALTGFTPSVVRAGIMHLVVLLCTAFFRRSDPMAALGLSLLVILIAKPYAAADISLLLSFSATLGILMAQKPMSEYISGRLFPSPEHRSIRRKSFIRTAGMFLIDAITVSFSAVLFSLPVTILYFRQIPVYGVLSSLLTVLTVPLLMGSVLLMLLFSMTTVLGALASPFAFIAGILTGQILSVAGLVSRLLFSQVSLYYRFVPVWVVFCVVLASALYLRKDKRHRVRIFALTALLTFVSGCTASLISQRDAVSIYVPHVGQGITAVIRDGDKTVVLACGGEKTYTTEAVDCIRYSPSDKISYLLLMNKNGSVSGYAARLMTEFGVETAGIYDEERFSDEVRAGLETCGRVLSFSSAEGKESCVEIGHCRIESLREKGVCAVRLIVKNYRLLLCCDGTDCGRLPQEWLVNDMLIVHGELKNTGLLSYDTLIISDREKYSDITYRELDGDRVLRTYEDGNISFRLRGEDQLIEMRERNWLS